MAEGGDDHEDGWPPPPKSNRREEAHRREGQDRIAGAIASDIAEIRRDLKELRIRQDQATETRARHTWEIELLLKQIDGQNGVKEQLREIRRDMPDIKILRSVVFGTIGLVMTGVFWAVLRMVGIGK